MDPKETPAAEVKPEAAAPEAKSEEKSEKKGLKLDTTRSMNSQVNKILSALPEEEKKDADTAEVKPEKSAEETKTDGETDESTPEESVDEEVTDTEAPTQVPKDVGKYIYEKLPQIPVMGHIGEEGEDRIFQVKRKEDLPEGFVFASNAARDDFRDGLLIQEMNARKLLDGVEQTQKQEKADQDQRDQQKQFEDWQTKQAIDVAKDIADLQKDGIMPKFAYSENDPKFNDDPAVKEANEIYDLYEKTNKHYADTKQPKFIGYRDAADKYYAQKHREELAGRVPEDTKPEKQSERDEVASKTTATSGATAEKQKMRPHSGMTSHDINRMVRMGVI